MSLYDLFMTRFNVEEEEEEVGDVELDTTAQRLHRWKLGTNHKNIAFANIFKYFQIFPNILANLNISTTISPHRQRKARMSKYLGVVPASGANAAIGASGSGANNGSNQL